MDSSNSDLYTRYRNHPATFPRPIVRGERGEILGFEADPEHEKMLISLQQEFGHLFHEWVFYYWAWNRDTKSNTSIATDGKRKSLPQKREYADEVRLTDVLHGRGAMPTNHPGTQDMRDFASGFRPAYFRLSRVQRGKMSRSIVQDLQAKGVRFLKQELPSGRWYIASDKEANEKVSHYLRDSQSAIHGRS